jgi:ribosomal protein S12 methylthiotransferase accessory factor
MTVGIVGSGPAAAAVEAAVSDPERIEVEAVASVELAVVVGKVGNTVFERATERARATGSRWLAVELGGVGGVPVVDAAIAGFGPDTGCYECLAGRVDAALDPETEPSPAPPEHTVRFAGAVAGREAARVLAGEDDGILGRVVELPWTERTFLPLPDCACDGERDRAVRRESVDRELSDSLARAERAVDDRVGVVEEVGEAESFPVPYYLARCCDTSGFSDATAGERAAGVDAGWDRAFMKALGEGLERYAAGVYRTAPMTTGRPEEVADAVPPAAFVTSREPEGEAVHWVPAADLSTGERVQVPAEFVHYPPPTERYRPAVTTGLGLGNGGAEALLAGLYEVVERDAAMLSWYSTFEPLAVSVDDEVVETLRGRARAEDLDVTLLLLTQDVDVPVVAAAVHRERWPALAFGTSAHLNVGRAARSALAEALQNWTELRGLGPEDAAEAGGAIGRYATFPDSVRSFVEADTTIPADSLHDDEVPAGEQHLETVIERVTDAGLTVYGARTTTRDVAALGFEAVRVLVPTAQPLFLGEAYFGERAETVPTELGFAPRLDRDHHPFP